MNYYNEIKNVFLSDDTPIIDMVKNSALTFHTELKGLLAEHKRIVNHLRIKVIWFRDFYYDGDKAYGESKFFELDDESQDFKDFVSGIQAAGGGDDPECGLEALSMAMRSDFTQEGTKRRHIIVYNIENLFAGILVKTRQIQLVKLDFVEEIVKGVKGVSGINYQFIFIFLSVYLEGNNV